MAKTYDHLFKLLLVGDSDAGKTSIINRLTEESLSKSYTYTIGVDYRMHNIVLNGKRIKLQIFDTAGEEHIRGIHSSYYRGASGILLVYDVTNERSFRNIRTWIQDVQEHAPSNVELMILGNLCNVNKNSRQVSRERGEQLAREFNCKFMEVSSETGHNVNEAFFTIAKDIFAKIQV